MSLATKEVMTITDDKKQNGHSQKYDPKVEYEYLAADVWAKKLKEKDKKEVAYSEEVREQLEENSEDNPENSDN